MHADAWYLPQVLEDPAIGSFEQVTVVKYASANEMQAAMIDFLTSREPDQLALLYISGHGVWSREVGQLYFVAASSKSGRLWETGLAAESVNEQLEACRARCKVAVLDCCFSGSFVQGFRTRGESGPPPEALSTRGVYVITASDTRETAYEGDTFNGVSAPSVFTGALLEGLRTGRADLAGDGLISVDELYQYIHQQVRSKNLPTVQTPTKSAHRVVGDIVLARSPIGSRQRPRDIDLPPSAHSGDRLRVPTSLRSVGASDSAPLDASQWKRMLEYWLDCVIQEAARDELLDLERNRDRFACWPGTERMLVGAVEHVQVPDELAEFVGNAAGNHKVLFYGYPAVILFEPTDRQRRLQRTLAPLFMQQLEVRQDAGHWTATRSARFFPTRRSCSSVCGTGRRKPLSPHSSRLGEPMS